jgi:hypothetical protein
VIPFHLGRNEQIDIKGIWIVEIDKVVIFSDVLDMGSGAAWPGSRIIVLMSSPQAVIGVIESAASNRCSTSSGDRLGARVRINT